MGSGSDTTFTSMYIFVFDFGLSRNTQIPIMCLMRGEVSLARIVSTLLDQIVAAPINCPPIHSKSEDSGIYYPAKKFELSANFSKNATKWPKNDPKWPRAAQI